MSKRHEITDIKIEIAEDITIQFFDRAELVCSRIWEVSDGGYKCKDGDLKKCLKSAGVHNPPDDFLDAVERIESAATDAHGLMMLGVP